MLANLSCWQGGFEPTGSTATVFPGGFGSLYRLFLRRKHCALFGRRVGEAPGGYVECFTFQAAKMPTHDTLYRSMSGGPIPWLAILALFACCVESPVLLAQNASTQQLKAYPLRNVAARQAEPALRRALGQLPEPSDISVDERGNRLLVRGSDRVHSMATETIERIDRAPGPAVGPNERQLKLYPYRGENIEQFAAELQRRYGDQARITADARRGQLYVVAPPALQQRIAQDLAGPAVGPQALARDATNWGNRPAQRQFSLRHARWDDIYPALKQVWGNATTETSTDGGQLVRYSIRSSGGATIQLQFDRRNQQIVLDGPGELVAQWARAIEILDRPADPQRPAARLLPLRNADQRLVQQAVKTYREGNPPQASRSVPAERRRVAMQLLSMFLQEQQPPAQQNANQPPEAGQDNAQPPAADAADGQAVAGPGLIGQVRVEYLPGLDIIILIGHPRDVERVAQIIEEIEQLSVASQPTIEVLVLRQTDSEAMAALVQGIYGEVLSARQGAVSITALVKPNALLLIGREESVATVVDLVRQLDQAVSPSSQFRVFRLRYAPADDVLDMLKQFYGDRVTNPQFVRPSLGTKLVLAVDVRSNALVVRASPGDIAEVESLLQKIDTPTSDAVNVLRVFQLQNSLAAELAPVLQLAIAGELLQPRIPAAPGTGGQAGGGATQVPGQAAGAGAGGQGPSLIKSTMLEFLAVDRSGQNPEEKLYRSGILTGVRVTADARGNALLVVGPRDSMDLIAALVEQLDRAPAAEAQIKVFTIVNGDAASLVTMMESLFGATQQGGGQQQGQLGFLPVATGGGDNTLVRLRFSVDQRTNSIIVSGNAADLTVVEAILLRLDESDVRQRKSEVFRLKNSPAIDVANAINEFLRSERLAQQIVPNVLSPFEQIEREVVVVPEPVSNSLIVSATPRFFDEIKTLVESLDQRPPMVLIQVLIAEVALTDNDEFGVELGLQDETLFERSMLENLQTITRTTTTQEGGNIVTTEEQTIVSADNVPGFNFNNVTTAMGLPNSGSTQAINSAAHIATQALSSFGLNRSNNELGFGGLVLSASSESVNILVRALQESRRLDVLSRPQVMTLDNQPAFIQVGQRVPRITASNLNEAGGLVNTTTLENVGLLLGVTPRISPDGLVVMEIDAEKSAVGPEAEGIPISVSPQGTVIRSPRIDTTTAQTTVSALSGQTIVLGGLITKRTNVIHRRLPLLADIPILGNLFRYDGASVLRTELLIIMTPHIVRNKEDADWLKQVEAARMDWVLRDVIAINGDGGLRGRGDHWDDCESETIYPDYMYDERTYARIPFVLPPFPQHGGRGISRYDSATSPIPMPPGGRFPVYPYTSEGWGNAEGLPKPHAARRRGIPVDGGFYGSGPVIGGPVDGMIIDGPPPETIGPGRPEPQPSPGPGLQPTPDPRLQGPQQPTGPSEPPGEPSIRPAQPPQEGSTLRLREGQAAGQLPRDRWAGVQPVGYDRQLPRQQQQQQAPEPYYDRWSRLPTIR